jgi:hypothetical protein
MYFFSFYYVVSILLCYLAPVTSQNEEKKDIYVLPSNSHIPEYKLKKILSSLHTKIISHLNIPYSDSEESTSTQQTLLPGCIEGQDYKGNKQLYGCYVPVYVCDKMFSGKCYWSFQQQCLCPQFWILKMYECRIVNLEVNLDDSEYKTVDIPIGSCRVAIWIWITIIVSSFPLVWVFLFGGVRFFLKKTY